MNVCVIGCDGNMGRRYMAILRMLEVEYAGVDLKPENRYYYSNLFTHFIIATPTDTHAEILHWLMDERPGRHRILVEKPVCKDAKEVANLAKKAEEGGHKVYMVNQYAYRGYSSRGGGGYGKTKTNLTLYDYYQSGSDGLAWDCIQLLHMAEGEIRLSNDSPVRACMINGRVYDSSHTDKLYVKMIRNFLAGDRKKYLWPIGDLVLAHKLAEIYSDWDTNEKCIDRGTGEIRINPIEKQMLDVDR